MSRPPLLLVPSAAQRSITSYLPGAAKRQKLDNGSGKGSGEVGDNPRDARAKVAPPAAPNTQQQGSQQQPPQQQLKQQLQHSQSQQHLLHAATATNTHAAQAPSRYAESTAGRVAASAAAAAAAAPAPAPAPAAEATAPAAVPAASSGSSSSSTLSALSLETYIQLHEALTRGSGTVVQKVGIGNKAQDVGTGAQGPRHRTAQGPSHREQGTGVEAQVVEKVVHACGRNESGPNRSSGSQMQS